MSLVHLQVCLKTSKVRISTLTFKNTTFLVQSAIFRTAGPVAALSLDQEAKKSKISVVHCLAILKGHPQCLKCGKTPDPAVGAYSAPADP